MQVNAPALGNSAHQLLVTSPGFLPALSAPFTVVPAAESRLIITSSPPEMVHVFEPFPQPLIVEVCASTTPPVKQECHGCCYLLFGGPVSQSGFRLTDHSPSVLQLTDSFGNYVYTSTRALALTAVDNDAQPTAAVEVSDPLPVRCRELDAVPSFVIRQ